MTQDLLTPEAAPELWRDNLWDRLLDSPDERTVIPIVGPDLLRVEDGGAASLLDPFIARRLARIYKLPEDDLSVERALNAVGRQLFRLQKDRYGICDDIFQVMKEADSQPKMIRIGWSGSSSGRRRGAGCRRPGTSSRSWPTARPVATPDWSRKIIGALKAAPSR
jgi:hypothetical protein